MIIERLSFENWGPFRGRHDLHLGRGLHVLQAENGAGKSAALLAIPYAIYGTIPDSRPERFVHDGESEMSVELALSDGTTIARGWGPAGGWVRMSGVEDARAADAVKAWVERGGLDAQDFRSTVFLGQGDPGRLVTDGPAARRELLGSWIVPAIWSTLAERAEARLKAAQSAVRGLQADLRSLTPEDPGELSKALEGALRARDEAAARSPDPEAYREAERQAGRDRQERERQAKLRALLDAEPPWPGEPPEGAPAAEIAPLRDRLARWRAELAKLEQLARGQFAGPCPVDSVPCPRADDIRGAIARHATRAAKGRAQVAELAAEVGTAEAAQKARQDALRAHERAVRDHEEWWRRVEPLLDAEPIDVDVSALRRAREKPVDLSGMDREIGALRTRLERAERDTRRVAELDARLAKEAPEVLAWQWMVRACGREGVPAMLLDSAIGEIAREGNAVLEASGCTLRFEFRLRRELKKPADRCRCGYVFAPRKRRCEECGEPRGQQVEHDCLPLVSDAGGVAREWRSSGQQAMLAVGFRIGAAAWLKRRSGWPWATLVLDEVEGPLSDRNVDAVREIVRSAPVLGFDQQILVSHRADTRASGHRLIRVIRESGSSRFVEE